MVEPRGIEPEYKIGKVTVALSELFFRCQLRCQFAFFWIEVVAEILSPFGNVCLGEVGVDISHGGQIIPSADLCGDHFRDLQVVG